MKTKRKSLEPGQALAAIRAIIDAVANRCLAMDGPVGDELEGKRQNMKSIAEQHQCWCIHYQRAPGSPKREACKKGIVYDEVATKGHFGSALRLPCVRGLGRPAEGQEVAHCPHLQFPTLEESQAHEKEIQAYIEGLTIVGTALVPIRRTHKGRDASGTIECPKCKGKLHWRHAGYNNHMRVCCETPECVNWIE